MRLPQDAVAKAVGVSRIPIREAIIALEREGWVTTKLHRGTFVNAFDEQIIRDHYELFGLVYGLAARRAAQCRDPEVLAKLAELVKQMSTTDDLVRIEELAFAFHSTVVEAARSPRITVVLRAMSRLVPGPFFVLVPEAVEPERKGLAAIVRAIRDGDGERAASEYAKMLSQQAELVVDLFHQRRPSVRPADGGVRRNGASAPRRLARDPLPAVRTRRLDLPAASSIDRNGATRSTPAMYFGIRYAINHTDADPDLAGLLYHRHRRRVRTGRRSRRGQRGRVGLPAGPLSMYAVRRPAASPQTGGQRRHPDLPGGRPDHRHALRHRLGQ